MGSQAAVSVRFQSGKIEVRIKQLRAAVAVRLRGYLRAAGYSRVIPLNCGWTGGY
jgi:hypothetical protein